MTLRQASNKIRKTLLPYNCRVKGKTVSFEGFGFGSTGFIDIECDQPLPPEALLILGETKPSLQSEENKFIVSLRGTAYPFGQKI
jgi:hypothetical protein